MARHRILKRVLKLLAAAAVSLGVVIAVTLFVMARKDKEHDRFFNTGKSVNQFLGKYKHALEESFKKREASAVAQLYSERYSSPGRGQWGLRPDREAGDVACLVVKAEGQKDYTKADLEAEVNSYLDSLASVEDIKF